MSICTLGSVLEEELPLLETNLGALPHCSHPTGPLLVFSASIVTTCDLLWTLRQSVLGEDGVEECVLGYSHAVQSSPPKHFGTLNQIGIEVSITGTVAGMAVPSGHYDHLLNLTMLCSIVHSCKSP